MIYISPISFQAKQIKLKNPYNVKKLAENKMSYTEANISFVEFEPVNIQDYEALKKISKAWKEALFADNIKSVASDIIKRKKSKKDNRIFFVTKQTDNFHQLDSESVLGIAHMYKDDSNMAELKYLQVLPTTKYGSRKREFKEVGNSIVRSILSLYDCNVKVRPYYPAVSFYERLGFKLINLEKFEYLWKKTK